MDDLFAEFRDPYETHLRQARSSLRLAIFILLMFLAMSALGIAMGIPNGLFVGGVGGALLFGFYFNISHWWKFRPYRYRIDLRGDTQAAKDFCLENNLTCKSFDVVQREIVTFDAHKFTMFTFAKEKEAAHFKLMWG